MTDSQTSSISADGICFPRALISINPRCCRGNKKKKAWIAISHRIYWKYFKKKESAVPKNLASFRSASSLELIRFRKNSCPKTVDEALKKMPDGSLVVKGILHGPEKWSRFRSIVTIQLFPGSIEIRDRWFELISLFVMPHTFHFNRSKNIFSCFPKTVPNENDNQEFDDTILVSLRDNLIKSFTCIDSTDEEKDAPFPGSGWFDGSQKLFENSTSLAESVLMAVKQVNTGSGKLVAEQAADIARCVSGLSVFFYLISLGATFCWKFSEERRGSIVLRHLISELLQIESDVVKCLNFLIHPNESEDEIHLLKKNVFEAREKILDLAGEIEFYLMCKRPKRIFLADRIRHFEKKIELLKLQSCIVELTEREVRINRNYISESHQWDRNTETRFSPPNLSTCFVGRLEERKKLKDILSTTGHAFVAGYGGIGKTQFMASFVVYARRENLVPGGVFWLTAYGGPSQLLESIAGLSEHLLRLEMSEQDKRSDQIVIASLRRGLSTIRRGRWVLCIDNVDDAQRPGVKCILDEVRSIANPEDGNGWVIITSRNSLREETQKFHFRPLTLEDSMIFIYKYTKEKSKVTISDDEARRKLKTLEIRNAPESRDLRFLCEKLGGLPLALVQVGTFINRHEVPISYYVELLRKACIKSDLVPLMWQSEEFSPVTEYQREMQKTWSINIENLSNTARYILDAVSLLGNAPISGDMMNVILESISNNAISTYRMHFYFLQEELIHGHSLLQRFEKSSVEHFEIHKLIAMHLVHRLKKDNQSWMYTFRLVLSCSHEFLNNILKKSCHSFLDLPEVYSTVHRTNLPHLLSLLEHLNFVNVDKLDKKALTELSEIMSYTGLCLNYFGRSLESKSIFMKLLDVLSCRRIGYHSMKTALALQGLGNSLRLLGKLDEAKRSYKRALDFLYYVRGIANRRQLHLARVNRDLGVVCQEQGEFKEAERYLGESRKIIRRNNIDGALDFEEAITIGTLGDVFLDIGCFDEARQYLEESEGMQSDLCLNIEGHPRHADILENLGIIYTELGDYNKAEEKTRKRLSMLYEIYGNQAQHPAIARGFLNLGVVQQHLGDHEESLENLGKALEMHYAIYGESENHPDIAFTHERIGVALSKMGKQAEAEESLKTSYDMLCNIHSLEIGHPSIANSLSCLGNVAQEQGKIDEASDYHHKCLAMQLAKYGRDSTNPRIASTYNNLGNVHEEQQEYQEAAQMYSKSLEMLKKAFESYPNHPKIRTVTKNLQRVQEASHGEKRRGIFEMLNKPGVSDNSVSVRGEDMIFREVDF